MNSNEFETNNTEVLNPQASGIICRREVNGLGLETLMESRQKEESRSLSPHVFHVRQEGE